MQIEKISQSCCIQNQCVYWQFCFYTPDSIAKEMKNKSNKRYVRYEINYAIVLKDVVLGGRCKLMNLNKILKREKYTLFMDTWTQVVTMPMQ